MNKAELYARYDNYGKELEVISDDDFYIHFNEKNKSNIQHYSTHGVECYEIRLDGIVLYSYSCIQNIGWEGDVECHNFFCKWKTMTKAEMEDMRKLFTSEAF